MKILLLIDSLISGGMQRRLVELVKGFAEYPDVQLKLITFEEEVHYTELYDLGVDLTILKRVPKKDPRVPYKVYQICREWEPDLLHTWGNMSAIMALPTKFFLQKKLINGNIVNSPESLTFLDERWLKAKLTAPFSSVVVSNSMAGLKAYGISEKKGKCIYNGFDTGRTNVKEAPKTIRERFAISTPFVIGMVGTFSDKKDHQTFIDAAGILLAKRRDVSFVLVGDGKNLEKFRSGIPEESKSYFVFTGLQKDVESIVNTFTVGVLATNLALHGEGISNAILEYMALKKPVITTRGGGTEEVVRNGITGYLVPPSNANILAEKIALLLNDPKSAAVMGDAGYADVLKKFSLKTMTKNYYELYKNQLDVNKEL